MSKGNRESAARTGTIGDGKIFVSDINAINAI